MTDCVHTQLHKAEVVDFTQDSEYKRLFKERPAPMPPMSPFEEKPEEKPKKRGNPNFYKGMPALNPTGRKKGVGNKYTALSRELMNNKGPEVVAKVIEKAMEGDVHCLKMCIDRILPVQKAVDPNRNKNDAQVIINVASIKSIEQKASEFEEAELVDVEEKDDDEVVVNVAADG